MAAPVVGGPGPGDADGLPALLTRICRQETAPARHLAEGARALRFGPHRLSLEGVAADEARGSQTFRAILARMDSYVTDLP